jgi:pimeloyl-ACP methyl ester carboxylesterase
MPPSPAPLPPPAGRREKRRTLFDEAAIRAVRLWFAVAGRIAPVATERQAARLMLTPRRRTPRDAVLPGVVARRRMFDAGGHRVAGWSWGDGPTVLLVHGWSGLAADTTDVAAGLIQAGFRVVAIDWPAHGQSPGRRTSLEEWVDVLLSLAPQLADGDEGLHAIVAHSFGAPAVVLAFEAGLVARGAVLLAPPRGPAQFFERVRRFIGLPVARVAGMTRRLTEILGRDLAFYDAVRAAAGLDIPALILHDPDDPEVPWENAEAIAQAWCGSRLVPMTGEGHYRILRSPRAIGQVVTFVRGLPLAVRYRPAPHPAVATWPPPPPPARQTPR